ncbi:outer membrane beta-barrel protein [Alteromonas sp. 14N.309.X.WAT.G.H12]|uniref:outer membrane beta-barrel protein n=1 Tax=Alteromonas sp. 14N.309.X.WAT.G.H12 TaxID=3120824 RepID=UPI002FCEA914
MEVLGMCKKNNIFIAATLLTAISSPSLAQTKLEPTGFLAEATTLVGYDDNILRTSEEYEKSDAFIQLKPELSLTGLYGKHKFVGEYEGLYSLYSDHSEVNYNDHRLDLRGIFDHSYNLNTVISAGYIRQHEEPWDTDRIFNDFTEFTIFDRYYGDFKVDYGREDSQGRLTFAYRNTTTDFRNNDQDYRDRIENRYTGRFYYRIGATTRIVTEAIYTTADYDEVTDEFERDNDNIVVRTGLAWDITNLISGEVKVGYQKRDYDLEQAIDSDGLSYEAELKWLPSTYTTWKLKARRLTLDSSLEDTGGFLRSLYSLELDHSFTDYTKLYGMVRYTDDELLTSTGREDNGYAATLSLKHSLNRLIEVGIAATYENRDSNIDAAIFTSRTIKATFKLTLD